MHRKDFIKVCGLGCLGVSALATLIQSCSSSNHFAENYTSNSQIVIKKSEFINSEKENSVERKYVLIKSSKHNFPICLFKIGDDKYSALLMECTHNSCELIPSGNFLMCPCHGSEFTNRGEVQNPPAEENLRKFKTTSDHDHIYIQI